ncbi:MAG: class I SAM-dependent methyltransferase [Dehalococcoidales bacterium]|jgi:SAM-dependent methyltransferase
MTNEHGGYELHAFIAEFYDTSYDRRIEKDVAFYVDYAKKANGRTLEMGCGTGRVLIPTAAAGCEITGLDLSAFMLGKCREKLAKQPQEVQKRAKLIHGDMTAFKTGEKYALVTLPFRPFQHLVTVAQQKACLQCVRQHLKPRGLFILDVFNPNPARLVPDPKLGEEIEDLPETLLPDGRKVRRASRIVGLHRDLQYNDVELIYYVTHPDGKSERLVEAFPMRYYYRYEMEHLLELGGFKIVEFFGDFDKSAFSDESPEMIFVTARKD